MSYMDGCPVCDEKNITIEFQQCQLDEIRGIVEDYRKNRDHWDWDNLLDDVMKTLEK